MSWIATSLTWYFYLFVIGIVFFPLAKKIFGRFFDQGYPFAKTLGIILISYLVFILGIFKILPFTRLSLIFILLFYALISFLIIRAERVYPSKLQRSGNLPLQKMNWPIIIFEEILFIVSFIFLTFIRGQEPSIHGLEKFMDFGFINSILRSKYFPPLDMWLSADAAHPNGYAINYYYFGHLTGALLIKLSDFKPTIGYNLILATIFAQGITLTFSLTANLVYLFQKLVLKVKEINYFRLALYGFLGSFIVNFAGNLHTIYLFTSGYSPEKPLPFWQILDGFNPTKYWYPNATRFIPYTIHEFPVYSYVVADLHGHVFDIPFVLFTLAIILLLFINAKRSSFQLLPFIFLGFLTAIHYMTNAFDGPIYILLTIFVITFIYGFNKQWLIAVGVLLSSFYLFSLPFSINFEPFVSGIGMNCSPDFLVNLHKIGPFLFEKGNCQISPLWMLFVLWGFFWVCFLLFILSNKPLSLRSYFLNLKSYIFILFSFGTFLIIIPEFFYIKDIYPQHFRANTMFKLGYQAFMMMGIASTFTFYLISLKKGLFQLIAKIIFLFFFFFIFIYSFYAFPSYYGKMDRPVILDGSIWMKTLMPADKEIIDYLNKNVKNQPNILEAQGDSYTDYERISAFTGLPTVAGWWVHEWLWRGSAEVVGKKIPDVVTLYESNDLVKTRELLKQYQIKYVVISKMEKEKYKNINQNKFSQLGDEIFKTTDGVGALYQVD
jgi:uncharacterized membrane protein